MTSGLTQRMAALAVGGLLAAFMAAACAQTIVVGASASHVHPSPPSSPAPPGNLVGADLEITLWDTAGTTNISNVENTSSSAYLTEVALTIGGGGVWDWVSDGSTFTVTEAGLDANANGMTSVVATLDFGSPGLAPTDTDANMSGDWDGTVSSIAATLVFSTPCTIEGALAYNAGAGPMGSEGLWTLSVSQDEGDCSPGGGGGGGGGGDPGEGEGDELVAGGDNYFVNPLDGSCNNSHNGQYPQFVSGSNGPWCSNDAVESASFTAATDSVWIIVGSTQTGAAAQLTNATITGTQSGGACTRHFIVGPYYMDGSTARRGTNGGAAARPILRGSAGYYDHTGSWTGGGTSADLYPASEFEGFIGVDDGRMSCTRWEHLHIKNAGGRGFTFDGVIGIEVANVFVEDVWDTGIHAADIDGYLVENSYVTGANHKRPDGGEPFVGAGIACSAPCANVTIRGNYIWDGWGEGINVFSFGGSRSAEDALIEDNFVMDVDSTLLYLDSLRDSIIRRNVLVRTARDTYWRNPGANYRGDCFTHSDEAYAVGTTPSFPSRDLLVTANICAGSSEGVNFAQWGSSEHARMYYYGNLFIDNEETIGSVDTTLTDSRWWSNASVLFGAYDHVRSGSGTADFDVDKNYWSSEPTAAWQDMDDVIGGCTLTKTTGWRNLENQGTPDSDGQFSVAEMLQVLSEVVAGARSASAAGCTNTGVAIASRTYPTNVSIEAGPADTDFDAEAYSTPDIGAFAL